MVAAALVSKGAKLLDGATIYILQCADGSYYTGITRRSVEQRLSEHAQGLIAAGRPRPAG